MARVSEEHLAERRQSILEAAARLFASRGFANATMAEIADEAGLSAGALYRYFESKQALTAACFAEGAEQFADQWRIQASSAPDAREGLFAMAQQSFDELLSEGANDRTRIMLERFLELTREGTGAPEQAREERTPIVLALSDALGRMRDEGSLPPTVDAAALGAALWSFWLGARVSLLIDPSADVQAQLDALRALLGAPGPAGPP